MMWTLQITPKLISDLLVYTPKNPLDAAVVSLVIQDALRHEERGWVEVTPRIGKHIHAAAADAPWSEREAGTIKPVDPLATAKLAGKV